MPAQVSVLALRQRRWTEQGPRRSIGTEWRGAMRAARYRRRGPPGEVLSVEETRTPVPGPGEVWVKMVASGVNPTDWEVRKGSGVTSAPVDDFQIPPHDGTGIVDAVGSDGIVGPRVWVYCAAFLNLRHHCRVHGGALEPSRTSPSKRLLRAWRLLGHSGRDRGALPGKPPGDPIGQGRAGGWGSRGGRTLRH